MKALVYQGPKQVAVCEVPVPTPKEGQALIRIEYCGICGSDIGIYAGTHPRAKAPLILGHEFVGVICEINGDAKGFAVGDRVAPYPLVSCGHCFACTNGREHVCDTLKIVGIDLDGGIAEYVCCDVDVLFKVPQQVSSRVASIIEPLAVAVHTLHRACFRPMDTIAIYGAGPVGILVAIAAQDCGAARVIISDNDVARLKLAAEMGFETVNAAEQCMADYIRKVTNNVGADIVFECTGAESAAAEMTRGCRTDGMICMVGVHKAPRPVLLSDMHFRELRMTATRVYTKRAFMQAVEYTKRLADRLEPVVSHVLPLSDCANVFDLLKDPNEATMKVAISCME